MTELCACGCGREIPERRRVKGRFRGPKRRYFNGNCRSNHWRAGKVVVDKRDLEHILNKIES